MAVARVATRDTEIGECPVHAGEQVLALIGAANIDADEFPDPDVHFDRGANRHIAFGAGPHRCVGSHLARLELAIALEEWHKRIPQYRVEDPSAIRHHVAGVSGVDRLPLVFEQGEA